MQLQSKIPSAQVEIITGQDVWLEGDAEAQLRGTAARLEDCFRAVGMPDLHPGPGMPIGAAYGLRASVVPRLIGSDAGCGVLLVVTSGKVSSLDRLERRVRSAFTHRPGASIHPGQLSSAAWAAGSSGSAGKTSAEEQFRALVDNEPGDSNSGEMEAACLGPLAGLARGQGTIGGGNHFVEISRVTEVRHRELASRLGLRRGAIVVLVHSGSRALGRALADRWGGPLTRDDEISQYMSELEGVCRVARANRFDLALRALGALGATRSSKIMSVHDIVHNAVCRVAHRGGEGAEGQVGVEEDGFWLHRKGAAPALAGQPTVILGSRGHRSWIMMGSGNPVGLWSIAHGAGRKMGRAEAFGKMRAKYSKKSLTRTRLGGRVICDRTELLYEEHPDAYKNVDSVVRAVEGARLADALAAVEPLVTVKR